MKINKLFVIFCYFFKKQGHKDSVLTLACPNYKANPNYNKICASGSADKTIKIWNCEQNKEKYALL